MTHEKTFALSWNKRTHHLLRIRAIEKSNEKKKMLVKKTFIVPALLRQQRQNPGKEQSKLSCPVCKVLCSNKV